MDVVLGVLLGLGLAASLAAGYRLLAGPRRVLDPEARAAQAALHAVTATLPHLRQGLAEPHAAKAAPHLRALVGAEALALADRDAVLAFTGAGDDHHHAGDGVTPFLDPERPEQLHAITRPPCGEPECPLGAAVVAPLTVEGEHVGSLIAGYRSGARLRPEDTRVVAEAASLVSALLELSELDRQHELLARAELRALRAQISPHFIYNALAAVAAYIHTNPDHARELLTEFAEFTRYAFRRERPYVTLADELRYVEKYLRLEQARFGERLGVRVAVAPEVLAVAVPVLSLQPLVENAVRHGVEASGGVGRVEIVGRDLGLEVELRVHDDGPGMSHEDADRALEGDGRGIGLSNVQSRLVQTFGPDYGLAVESGDGSGTTITMVLPKFRAGVRAA
jgi:two-component system LytT family sensor kinase